MAPGALARARILVVDDAEANVELLARVLRRAGYAEVSGLTDPRRVRARFVEDPPDLLLLDLHMPWLDGFAVMEQLAPWIAGEAYLPTLVLTADATADTKRRALARGARDFLTKPFDLAEVLLRINNLLETRFLHEALRRHNESLEERVRERTAELERARTEVLERLGRAAEYRDDDTHEHTSRVGATAGLLARALDFAAEEAEVIRRAAPLHDLGKIGVPDAILLKPGPLDPEEIEAMRAHARIGAEILSGGSTRLLRLAEAVARSHHERWDGTGYPEGLAGEAIPAAARVVGVADVFDALVNARPYKPAWPFERAVAEIRAQRERQFDPVVVDAFVALAEDGRLPGAA